MYPFRKILLLVAVMALVISPACKRGKILNREYMYVSAQQVNVRDRLAAVYNKVAVLKNGDRVEVIDRQKRFVKVRIGEQEGWLEQRYLISQEIYDALQQLAKDNASVPAEGRGATRAELNMHLDPARDSEHLYQLKDGEKIDILKRAIAEKKTAQAVPGPKPRPKPVVSAGTQSKDAPTNSASSGQTGAPAVPEVPKVYEDWWLVRNAEGRTGWVLARMVDLDVPLEIAQYAEGQRIQGYKILNTVQDEQRGAVPQYVVMTTEPKDGLPFDFNHFRVFSWNLKRHRYETAYRERNLFGVFPATVGTEDFGKEGVLPVFTIRVKDEAGQVVDKKYRMIGPIVRRVLTAQEQAAEDARRAQTATERMQKRQAAKAAQPRAARRAAPSGRSR